VHQTFVEPGLRCEIVRPKDIPYLISDSDHISSKILALLGTYRTIDFDTLKLEWVHFK
jgi:hypothetical protein